VQEGVRLPITSTATPISAAAEQQHDYDDNQKHFHGKSPLMVMCGNAVDPQARSLFGPTPVQRAQNQIFDAPD
jgi:hypothetical protein